MSPNLKTLFVANPQSGGGSLGRRWGAVAETIRQAFGPFEHRFTERSGHATAITREALLGGYEQVVAIGGDGHLSQVAAGFMNGDEPLNADALLGVLPFGTGGDFSKTTGISKQLAVSAAALRGRQSRPLDIGRFHYHRHDGTPADGHFINIASFGMGGVVDRYVNESSKRLGGTLTFLMATVRGALVYRNAEVSLTLDDQPPFTMKIVNVAVANGQYFGGGMRVAPTARVDDGILEVVGIGDFSTLGMLLTGYKIYLGTHLKHPKVHVDQARRVEARPVHAGQDVLLDIDGEAPGKLPATFEIIPAALKLKVKD